MTSIPFSLEIGNCQALRAELILSNTAMCRTGVKSKPLVSRSHWRKRGASEIICFWNLPQDTRDFALNISTSIQWRESPNDDVWLGTKLTDGWKEMGWTPFEWHSILGTMSWGWPCNYQKTVWDRTVCDTVGFPVDLQSQFMISGRRTLLLSGKNSRKSSIICCLVNMPWTTVSLLFCFYWALLSLLKKNKAVYRKISAIYLLTVLQQLLWSLTTFRKKVLTWTL